MLSMSGAPRQGFSLMEIMIAIAIMGVLGAVLVPKLMNWLAGSRVSAAKQSLRVLKNTIDLFNAQLGDYPDTLKDLYKKPANEELAKEWTAPFVDENKLVDPWKKKFHYTKTPGQDHPYELYSYGPKGKSSTKSERIDAWAL